MPYVASNPDQYADAAPVGSGECVALVERATGAPIARMWSKGPDVRGNAAIARGTAIATFDAAGRYPNHPHGNHAAIYLGQDASGIQVIDQWRGQRPHVRTIYFNNRRAAPDNGNMFSVVQ